MQADNTDASVPLILVKRFQIYSFKDWNGWVAQDEINNRYLTS